MLPPPLRRLASQYPIKKLCSSEDLLRFLTETEEKLAALKPPVARKIHSLLESELESERTGKWRDRGYLFLKLGGGKMRFGPMPKDPTLGGFLLVAELGLVMLLFTDASRIRPLMLEGRIRVQTPRGEVVRPTDRVSLCRCGGTLNQPFCDGSHLTAGFKSTR